QPDPPEQQVGGRVVAQGHGEPGEVPPAHLDLARAFGRTGAAELVRSPPPYALGRVELPGRDLPRVLQHQMDFDPRGEGRRLVPPGRTPRWRGRPRRGHGADR